MGSCRLQLPERQYRTLSAVTLNAVADLHVHGVKHFPSRRDRGQEPCVRKLRIRLSGLRICNGKEIDRNPERFSIGIIEVLGIIPIAQRCGQIPVHGQLDVVIAARLVFNRCYGAIAREVGGSS